MSHKFHVNTDFQFVVWMTVTIGRATKTEAGDALPVAGRAFREFLRDEGVEFGDPAYAWDKAAAETLAREYVLEYAEAAP